MTNSCSMFFYEGYVGVAPTIINLAKSLSNEGYLVTIYATENPYPQPEDLGNKSAVIYFHKASENSLIVNSINLFYKFRVDTLIPVIDLVVFTYNCLRPILKQNNPSTSLNKCRNIGIDSYGAIVALVKFYLFRQKYIYLSLELNHPLSFKKFAKVIHLLERLAFRNSEGIIVQDEDRFKTLCEYNQYQHPQVFYLPNSPIYSESLVQKPLRKNYFREILNLNEEEFPCIVLQAGVINDDVFSKELAQAFVSINQCALVFHERVKRSPDEVYMKDLQKINSKNLFLSLEPVPYEDIDKIYESATIGLAFYRDLDRNFSQISMASGKLSHYLKQGKPVLVNNLESLSRLVEKYKIGMVIQDPSNNLEIESAVKMILSDYKSYSENAKRCFEEEFDFAKKVKPILSFIDSF